VAKKETPLLIAEEYYQISMEILTSFPKYRLPLPLFIYRHEVGQLQTFVPKDTKLSNEQVERMHALCVEGDLFVSRADYPIYSKHIIKQLDLILVDRNFKEGEVADICVSALAMRLQAYLEQPVKMVFDLLMHDVLVFTEYISADFHRLRLFMRRLNRTHSLVTHSINCLIVGMWIYSHKHKTVEIKRKDVDRLAMGLILHDAGMSKVPAFIINKTTPLKPDEKEKIPPHTLIGGKMVQKTELGWDELVQAATEHHERLNGSGYPRKASGNEISATGRLTAVVDSFCAMITTRSYAPAKDLTAAAQELAADTARYDEKYTVPLRNALITKEFGEMSSLTPTPQAKEAEQ
jgi:response regulator RpfG family c-di-GMP phosphodiesterase